MSLQAGKTCHIQGTAVTKPHLEHPSRTQGRAASLRGAPHLWRGRAERWASHRHVPGPILPVPCCSCPPRPARRAQGAGDGTGRDGLHSPPSWRSRSRGSCSRRGVPAPRLAMVSSAALASPGAEKAASPGGRQGLGTRWAEAAGLHCHRLFLEQNVLSLSASALPAALLTPPPPARRPHRQSRRRGKGSAESPERGSPRTAPAPLPIPATAPCARPQARPDLISALSSRCRAEICGLRAAEGDKLGEGSE